MKLVVHFDGGGRQAGLICAGAAVVYDEHGNELATRAHLLRHSTVPVAEYTGLILGLSTALELGGTDVTAWGDAELIIRQVDGRYQAKKDTLRALRDQARSIMAMFAHCEVKEFPKAGPQGKRRYSNDRADQLANDCMNGAT